MDAAADARKKCRFVDSVNAVALAHRWAREHWVMSESSFLMLLAQSDALKNRDGANGIVETHGAAAILGQGDMGPFYLTQAGLAA